MSILPDKKVKIMVKKGLVTIDPFFDEFLGPNLYYCHLGTRFLLPKNLKKVNPLDKTSKDIYRELVTTKPIEIKPGGFILAETFEFLGVDANHVIRLLNSSSLARVGISQAAVGMMNPGCGIKEPAKITLELVNNAPFAVTLVPTTINKAGEINWGTSVLKIAVETMESAPSVPYDEWKSAVYHVDKKPSGPKMKDRFNLKENKLPKSSRYWKEI